MEEEKFLTSAQAAKLLHISQDTLARWDKDDTFKPAYTTPKGYRYYTEEQIAKYWEEAKARAQQPRQPKQQTTAIVPVKEVKKKRGRPRKAETTTRKTSNTPKS